MKVSTRVEYGMLALVDIAVHTEDGSSVSAPDIVERQNISHKYLEQILTFLKQAGLIRAQKGLRGGYTLSHPAEEIRLSEVIDALDNSILEEMGPTGNDDGSLRAAVNACLWEKLNRLMFEFVANKTLAMFVQECRNQTCDEWDMYTI